MHRSRRWGKTENYHVNKCTFTSKTGLRPGADISEAFLWCGDRSFGGGTVPDCRFGIWGGCVCVGTRGEKRREAGISSFISVLDSLWGPSALNKNVLRAHRFNKSYDLQGPGSKGRQCCSLWSRKSVGMGCCFDLCVCWGRGDGLEDKRMSVGQVSNRNEFPFILRV